MTVLLEPGSIKVYKAVLYIFEVKEYWSVCLLSSIVRGRDANKYIYQSVFTLDVQTVERAQSSLWISSGSPCGVLILELIPGHQGSGNISSFFPLLLLVYKHTYISTHTKTS
jgi:hypothetical protein